jgi:hypothetical protein
MPNTASSITTNLPYTNQTADVYRSANSPPTAPDLAGLKILLEEVWANIKPTNPAYTHTALFAVGNDVHDADKFYVPNNTAADVVIYTVQFVARRGKGTAGDLLVAYLSRTSATWPTQNL